MHGEMAVYSTLATGQTSLISSAWRKASFDRWKLYRAFNYYLTGSFTQYSNWEFPEIGIAVKHLPINVGPSAFSAHTTSDGCIHQYCQWAQLRTMTFNSVYRYGMRSVRCREGDMVYPRSDIYNTWRVFVCGYLTNACSLNRSIGLMRNEVNSGLRLIKMHMQSQGVGRDFLPLNHNWRWQTTGRIFIQSSDVRWHEFIPKVGYDFRLRS